MDFGNLFSFDNPVWKYVGRIWDAIWLTVLWTVFSLPIITVGASSMALFYVALKMVKDEEGAVTKQFVKAFRDNFKQATLLWLLMVVIGVVLGVNLWFYYQVEASFARVFLIVLLVFTYIFLMLLHYVFAVTARFDDSIRNLLALSFWLSMKNFGWTLLMITSTVCSLAVGVCVFSGRLAAGSGLAALLDAWMFGHIFDRYIEVHHYGEAHKT